LFFFRILWFQNINCLYVPIWEKPMCNFSYKIICKFTWFWRIFVIWTIQTVPIFLVSKKFRFSSCVLKYNIRIFTFIYKVICKFTWFGRIFVIWTIQIVPIFLVSKKFRFSSCVWNTIYVYLHLPYIYIYNK